MSHQHSVQSFNPLLHICRLERNHAVALHIRSCLSYYGLDASTRLGNHLASMLADVGNVHVAWNVFSPLPHRTASSWNSLIAGLVKLGDSQLALTLYERMREDSLHPNGHTYVALLRACTESKDIHRGCKLHLEISKQISLERDPYVNSALVHMYASSAFLVKAQEVFDKLPYQSAVAWNALITGYAKHAHGEEALFFFDQMQQKRITPTAVTFVSGLKACGSIGAVEKGKELHAETARKGLSDTNVIIQSALVDMYAKCGSLTIAQQVFDKLSIRNVVTWTSLITGYIDHEYGKEALNCFELMRYEGISPNAVTYACSLKACGIIGAISKGSEICSEMSEKGSWKSELTVSNAVIDMYVKCGSLARAQELFDELPFRDVVSWNVLMTGYAKYELFEEILDSFEQMTREGISPDAVTHIVSLKACGSSGVIDRGRDIHAEVARLGLLKRDLIVGNVVVDMYTKCGFLGKAQEVFDQLLVRDVVSWTVLISGYADQSCGKKALKYYKQMHLMGVYPNPVTFVCILKVCGSIKDEGRGMRVHARIAGNVLLERDPAVCSALIGMYVNCGLLSKAKETFDKSPVQNGIVWNAMLAGYANHDHCEKALQFFDMRTLNGLCADKIAFLYCLKACGVARATDRGKEIHAGIATKGWLSEKDNVVGNALINMYAKCGLLVKAQGVLDKLIVQDTVSWTALIAGYVKHNHGKGALTCFEQMLLAGVFPNAVTFNLGLKACAIVGALEKGQEMHFEIARQGLSVIDPKVSTSLIIMYAKCGQLAKAHKVFDECASRSVIVWNSLISGYAKHGKGEKAVICFEEMQHEGVCPDNVTFLNLLSACNRAGLADEGHMYFNAVSDDHDVRLNQEHRRCMADLFGRVGDLEGAREILIPPFLNPVVFRSMLRACRSLGNMELGRAVFKLCSGIG